MFLIALLAGCPTGTDLPCTDLFAWSVTVNVTTESGEALEGLAAVYTVDGGPEQPCQEPYNGVITCGGEEEGHFVITVDATDYDAATVEVDVAADECHVITEVVDVELLPTGCDDYVAPSVIVNLATDSGGALPDDAAVSWDHLEDEMAEQPCTEVSDGQFQCAQEKEGELLIRASAAGYATVEETVLVELTEDECHVDTQTIDLVLVEGNE